MTIQHAQLPEGWEECRLEDNIKLIDYRGRTPVKTESGVRLITAKNVKLGYLQLDPQEFIAEDDYESWMTRGIPKFGDVIFTTEAPLANVAQIESYEKLAFAQRIIVMQPNSDKIDQTFLKYMLLSQDVRQRILAKGTGATVTGIKSSLLKKIRISYPPLPHQQLIVSILNRTLAAIDQAKVNAQKNLQNAKELFESYLQGVFENRGEGWKENTLGEICELVSGQHIDAQDYNFDQKGIGYLTGPSDFGNIYPTVTKWTEFPKRSALSGDILITVKGSGVGKINLMSEDELCISRQLMAIRPKKVNTNLLYAFIKTKQIYFQSLANGAAIPGISRGDVLNLKMHLPELKDQQDIVCQLEILQAETQKLETLYQKKIAALDELKKSILQKAFQGELETDKELAL